MYLCEVVSPSGEYKKIYMCIVVVGRVSKLSFQCGSSGCIKIERRAAELPNHA